MGSVTGNGVAVDTVPAHALRMLLAARIRVPRADLARKHYAALPIDLEVPPPDGSSEDELADEWLQDWSRLWDWYSSRREAGDVPPLRHQHLWRSAVPPATLHRWRWALLGQEKAAGGLTGQLDKELVTSQVRQVLVLPLEPFRAERLNAETVVVSTADRLDVDRYLAAVRRAGPRYLL